MTRSYAILRFELSTPHSADLDINATMKWSLIIESVNTASPNGAFVRMWNAFVVPSVNALKLPKKRSVELHIANKTYFPEKHVRFVGQQYVRPGTGKFFDLLLVDGSTNKWSGDEAVEVATAVIAALERTIGEDTVTCDVFNVRP